MLILQRLHVMIIIYETDIVSTNMTNVSINFDDKKVRYKTDTHILHTVLLVIMLLLIIAIICYHYTNHRSKQKGTDALTIYNGIMEYN